MELVALRMVSVRETAQDLVQEAMLQAFLSLSDLRKEGSFRSWLYGIVLNLSKGYLRSQRRYGFVYEPLGEDHPAGLERKNSVSQDPFQVVIERDLHQLVLQAIETLPPAHRETTRMYYLESLTLHEIVNITGASPGTIKVRLHRARNQLREKLHHTYPEIKTVKTSKVRRKLMKEAKVVDIRRRDEKYIIVLQEDGGEKVLPIWIGAMEGAAIAMGLRAFPTFRPMTYEFIVRILDTLGAQVEAVQVEALKETTFYGIVKVRIGNEIKEIDARPSDVIALAVRTSSPIYLAEEVMVSAGVDIGAYESEYGQLIPGEGIDVILKEMEQKLK